MFRVLFFAGLGITAAGIGLAIVGATSPTPLLIIGMLLATGMLVLIQISRSTRGMATANDQLIRNSIDHGRQALARVDEVQQTGTEINGRPLCVLTLTVQPRRGPAYRVRARRLIPMMQAHVFAPGAELPAVVLTEGGPETAIVLNQPFADEILAAVADVTVPPEEEAGDVRTAPDGIVRDDGTRRKPLLGLRRKGRAGRFALYAVAFVVAATLSLVPYHRTVDFTAHALQQGELRLQGWDPYYLEVTIPELEEQLGHDRVTSIYVRDSGVFVDALVSPETTHADRWWVHGASVDHEGATSPQPSSTREAFSLAEVRWEALSGLVDRAIAEAGATDVDSIGIYIQREIDSDVHSDDFGSPVGDIVVRITVNSPYENANFTAAPDGSGFERAS
jgi:hypothetical protein